MQLILIDIRTSGAFPKSPLELGHEWLCFILLYTNLIVKNTKKVWVTRPISADNLKKENYQV